MMSAVYRSAPPEQGGQSREASVVQPVFEPNASQLTRHIGVKRCGPACGSDGSHYSLADTRANVERVTGPCWLHAGKDHAPVALAIARKMRCRFWRCMGRVDIFREPVGGQTPAGLANSLQLECRACAWA
jgi:hypothetical protein